MAAFTITQELIITPETILNNKVFSYSILNSSGVYTFIPDIFQITDTLKFDATPIKTRSPVLPIKTIIPRLP